MRVHHLALALLLASLILSGCSDSHKSSYDYLSKARQYHQKGNDAAAVIELKNALQKDPKNMEARYLIAIIDNERGKGASRKSSFESLKRLA